MFAYNGLGQRTSKVVRQILTGNGGWLQASRAATAARKTGQPSPASAQRTLAATATATSAEWLDDSTWPILNNTRFFYDDSGRLLGEYDSTVPANNAEHVWFNGQPVAMVKGGVVYRVHADNLGTPRSLTRASDNFEVWKWTSEPFGSGQASIFYNLRFAGQYADEWTGLHYNMARYYEPLTGRYTQADPIGLAGGISRYAYVGGNPLSFTDPRGLDNPGMGPYGPFPGSMGFRRGVPGNSCTCMVGSNTFYAPPGTNFSNVRSAGQANGWNPMDVNRNVGHWGTFDFQRDAGMNQFTGAYTNAANFGVGVYMQGAGYSRANTGRIAGGFAGAFSSNAGDPNQAKYWMMGWDAANSGNLEYACQ